MESDIKTVDPTTSSPFLTSSEPPVPPIAPAAAPQTPVETITPPPVQAPDQAPDQTPAPAPAPIDPVTAPQNAQTAAPSPAPVEAPASAPQDATAPAVSFAAAPAPATPVTGVAVTPMPEELKGWNWGAFFMSWVWAIAMKTTLGIVLGVLTNVVGMIILGLKGNEWAWQSRKFASVDEFKAVQKAWAKWGLIIFIVGIIVLTAAVVSAIYDGGNNAAPTPVPIELR